MTTKNGHRIIKFDDFELDAAQCVLMCGGEVVRMPRKSVEVLRMLAESEGEVVSKDALMQAVWPEAFVEDAVLTQNIYTLRKLFKSHNSAIIIKNIPRRGYILECEMRPVRNGFIADAHRANGNSHVPVPEIASAETDEHIELPPAMPLEHKSTFWRIPAFAVFVLLIAAGFGGYKYLNGNSQQAAANSPAAVRLKPVTQPSSIKTLAVLPFTDTEPSFGNTFANDISIRTGSANKFNVTPFALVRDQINRDAETKADYVLEGAVTVKNNVFAANVRLRSTADGAEIWAEQVEYPDLGRLQDAVANRVVKEITERFTGTERELAAKRLPTNFTAYEHFQNGLANWRVRDDGRRQFVKAIEYDRSFARAYALLAAAEAMAPANDNVTEMTAEQLLARAFELDDNLADAYAVQGFIRIFHYRDWDGAERSLKNAIELDGNNINARHWLGEFYKIHRRFDEAKTELLIALDNDPTNPTLLADLGQAFYFEGNNEAAMEYVNKALSIKPGHGFANGYLAILRSDAEPPDQAQTILRIKSLNGQPSFELLYLNADPKYAVIREDPDFKRAMNVIGF